MIAIDSPVLIELLSDGPRADAVEACLRQALVGGRVVVCGTTLAEICAPETAFPAASDTATSNFLIYVRLY